MANTTAFEGLTDLRGIFLFHRHGRGADFRSSGPRDHGAWEFETRYWGQWENPQGAEHEQDYDWPVPTAETSQCLTGILAEFNQAHPHLHAEYFVEEESWITVTVTPKQTP